MRRNHQDSLMLTFHGDVWQVPQELIPVPWQWGLGWIAMLVTWIIPGLGYVVNKHADCKCPKHRVVGPLPNLLKWLYKWGGDPNHVSSMGIAIPPSSEWQSPSIPTKRQPTWLVQDHFMLYGSSDRHDESTVLPSPNVEAVHRKRKKGAVVETWLAYLPCKLIKVAPENWWLEDDSFILGGALFSGATFVSGRVNVAFDEKEEVAWKNLT